MNHEPGRKRLPAGLIALRETNFNLYVLGQFTSQLGSWIELTAVSWIVYEMTDSPLLLGLVGLFRALPTILLALVGGAIADRVPRRFLLLCTESVMLVASLVVGLLAVTGHLQYWHFYILNLVSGTIQAFSVPARHALFANLVPRSSMASAVVLNSVAVRGGGLLGPAIAGLALSYAGYALPFFLNAASFVAMFIALALMRLPSSGSAARAAPPSESWPRRMTEGVAFAWRMPLLRVALGLELATGLFGQNSALMTIIVRDVLGAGPEGLGIVMSALSAGALLGMTLLVSFHVERHGRLILAAGAAYAVLWLLFGFSQSLWWSAALAVALGTIDSISGVMRNTVAQLLVPDTLRGRVMSVVMLVTRGSSQLGRVQSGFVAGLIGAQPTVLLGAGIIGAALLALVRLPLPEKISAERTQEREAYEGGPRG